jgi:N-acetylated-alpha-linked acidic dipeptidase
VSVLIAIVLAAAADRAEPLIGFTSESARRQRELERVFLRLPDAAHCEAHHRELTRAPHTAGTPGSGRVAEYVASQFREYGLETQVVEYEVLLSHPRRVEAAMVAPRPVRLAHREDILREDPQSRDPGLSGPWHAYARSGQVTAEVVYVNHGRPADYDVLADMGIDVRGRIVLARHFKGYRGGKSLEAERRGVAALITYSDPAEDGYVQGDVFPRGPWGPDSHIQRGANVYDFIVPGDPLTPGWASVPGAPRIPEEESRILPRIPSLPLSFKDARVILQALAGPVRPEGWQGGGPFAYHVGPGPARVRLSIDVPRELRTIRNVVARIPGRDPSVAEQLVLLSNHHDAWTFGGVDPSSGTTSALELARSLGELVKKGLTPRRSLVIGIWDAEEFTLTGSTEWGEEHEDELARNAVACLNVDASTSGDRLSATAVPSLRTLLYQAARDVEDPKGRGSLYDVWRAAEGQNLRAYGVVAGARTEDPPVRILGSGSDYTVFFNHIGVPSMDLLFDGPYGVYHSAYDSHTWMRRFGDPGFLYHAAMARLWGLLALRLANADVLPFDYGAYGRDLVVYLDDLAAAAATNGTQLDLAALRAEAAALAAWTPPAPVAAESAADLNRALLHGERDLLAAEGIPGRPWFRHLIYAPLPSYEAETLPGIREAVVEHDAERTRSQAELLAAALRRLRQTLSATQP